MYEQYKNIWLCFKCGFNGVMNEYLGQDALNKQSQNPRPVSAGERFHHNQCLLRSASCVQLPDLCMLKEVLNTLRTGDANLRLLRFCITTVKDR
jgi:hypothetical protein